MASPENPELTQAPSDKVGGAPQGIFPRAIGAAIEKTAYAVDSTLICGLAATAVALVIAIPYAVKAWSRRSRQNQPQNSGSPPGSTEAPRGLDVPWVMTDEHLKPTDFPHNAPWNK